VTSSGTTINEWQAAIEALAVGECWALLQRWYSLHLSHVVGGRREGDGERSCHAAFVVDAAILACAGRKDNLSLAAKIGKKSVPGAFP
jgi:hypothetical protein